jgi:hypothetical protein
MILVLGLTLVLGAGLYAQVTKDTKTGLDRIDGTIIALDKDKSTLTLKQTGRNATFHVAYTDKTSITLMNKAAKLDALKEGVRVIALGKMEQMTLNASRIDIRTAK